MFRRIKPRTEYRLRISDVGNERVIGGAGQYFLAQRLGRWVVSEQHRREQDVARELAIHLSAIQRIEQIATADRPIKRSFVICQTHRLLRGGQERPCIASRSLAMKWDRPPFCCRLPIGGQGSAATAVESPARHRRDRGVGAGLNRVVGGTIGRDVSLRQRYPPRLRQTLD